MKNRVVLSVALFSISAVFGMEQLASQPLRIMTFNVRRAGKEKDTIKAWPNRQKLVIQTLKNSHPDIFGLQEPTIEQIQDIAQGIGADYAWVGQGRGKEWWGKSEDEYNPLFYNRKRLDLLDSGTFVLNPSGMFNWRFIWSPTTVGLLTRISTWGKFRDKLTDKQFYVYNTHLDNKFGAAQVHGMQTICTKMNECQVGLPVIFMGDFNTELTPALLADQLKDFNNSQAIAQTKVGPEQTRTGWDFKELKKIDHILVNKGAPLIVQKHEVVQEENKDALPSDHRPVYIDIAWIK